VLVVLACPLQLQGQVLQELLVEMVAAELAVNLAWLVVQTQAQVVALVQVEGPLKLVLVDQVLLSFATQASISSQMARV
jgi:hypothetical protein